jgi:hypothetical protein
MLRERRASLEQRRATNRLSCRVDSFRIRRAVIGNKLEKFYADLASGIKLSSITVPKCDSPPMWGTWPGSSTLQQSGVERSGERRSMDGKGQVTCWMGIFCDALNLPNFLPPLGSLEIYLLLSYLNIYFETSERSNRVALMSFVI